jgi:hypothetical protein
LPASVEKLIQQREAGAAATLILQSARALFNHREQAIQLEAIRAVRGGTLDGETAKLYWARLSELLGFMEDLEAVAKTGKKAAITLHHATS